MASKFMPYTVYESFILGREDDLTSSKYKDEKHPLSRPDDYPPSPTKRHQQQRLEELFYPSERVYSPCPCSYHIEDVQNISASDLKPINISSYNPTPTTTDTKSSVPEVLISCLTPPPDDDILPTYGHYDTWGNADEIPTRAPSADLDEDFPPLMRCRDHPAMGWYPDDLIVDITYDDNDDDDSMYDESVVASEWSSFLASVCDDRDVDDDDVEEEAVSSSCQSSGLFCCKEGVRIDVDFERKADETWSVVSQESNTVLSPPMSYWYL